LLKATQPAGLETMRRGIELMREQNVLVFDGLFKIALAEAEAFAGDVDRAVAILGEALATCERTSHRAFEAELHRARGDILLKRIPPEPAPAEEALQTAVAIAKEQRARTYELRASLSLARLYQSTHRPADAHGVLAPAPDGFAPTRELPEIAEAQALLAALAETDEVKAAVVQRERVAHLRVAYGNALMAARGYGAPETAEAFARARESAPGAADAPERLAVDFGLWVGCYYRGELPQMRTLSEAILNEVRESPESSEACVAHRVAGLTHWFAGEHSQAQRHLARSLALFQPGRDDDLAFRFGMDGGVNALAYLAIATWPLGEIDRAASFLKRAQERAASVAHAVTRAHERLLTALFELMRGGHPAAGRAAVELADLAREHDLKLWRAFGVFLEGWLKSETGAPADGLEDMRRGAALLREQNVVIFDGLLKIAHAEAEARAGEPARAIAIIDDALATSDQTGHRAFDAELRRVRGEVLAQGDPANRAAAEQAYRTAIAVAQQQGARSYELRAALALAKLYQSTGRLVEAHAVLAPALEGFMPTAEMPEIAEAQALLAALAETEEVKTADAQIRRRLHLQTTYGQAMMMAKGYAAEETRAAFFARR
jgi:predicted ATPase